MTHTHHLYLCNSHIRKHSHGFEEVVNESQNLIVSDYVQRVVAECKDNMVEEDGAANPRPCVGIANSVFILVDDDVILNSCYMEGEPEIPPPPPKLIDLVNYCISKNLKLIIGSDVNAHHTLWGSTNVNNRGETLLKYILSTYLIILNRGR